MQNRIHLRPKWSERKVAAKRWHFQISCCDFHVFHFASNSIARHFIRFNSRSSPFSHNASTTKFLFAFFPFEGHNKVNSAIQNDVVSLEDALNAFHFSFSLLLFLMRNYFRFDQLGSLLATQKNEQNRSEQQVSAKKKQNKNGFSSSLTLFHAIQLMILWWYFLLPTSQNESK